MVLDSEFPEGFRLALRHRGFEPGESRQPKSPEQKQHLTKLGERIRRLMQAEGFGSD